jgi:NADP-dependent 3-hydroxy acid dehydrogenase YdfG
VHPVMSKTILVTGASSGFGAMTVLLNPAVGG